MLQKDKEAIFNY